MPSIVALTLRSTTDQHRSLSGYEKVREDEESESSEELTRSPETHPWRRWCCNLPPSGLSIIILLAVVAILSFILAFSVNLGQSSRRVFKPLETSASTDDLFSTWHECGHTVAEARSRGCVFDLMLSTWIHESCYNDEMMNRYLLEGNHRYYRDENQTQEMTEEEARRGEHSNIWTDGEFHLRHCVYLMDMQIRSYLTGRPIEATIYRYKHSLHCVNLTLAHNRDGHVTKLHAVFGKCGFPKL